MGNRRGRRAAIVAAAIMALAAPRSEAADPQPYTVDLGKTGNDAVDQALRDASNLSSLEKSAPVEPFALIERARQDDGRFAEVLHSFGYYKGGVDITIAGHSLADTRQRNCIRGELASSRCCGWGTGNRNACSEDTRRHQLGGASPASPARE